MKRAGSQIALFLTLTGALAASEGDDFFERRVRPVLHENCQNCHGPEKQKGGLRVDSRAALLKGGDTSAAIKPGDPAGSLLLRAVKHLEADLEMPPAKSGKSKLADAVIADVESWIKMGAPFPGVGQSGASASTHWAFQALETKVDLSALSAPGTAADKRTLIRRATYDLTGLPPTPEEVDAFLNDASADAYPRLVERLLQSSRYGERWGRKWLDVVRYADTAGENSDHPVREAWRYRNWVINAFNRDMPYDEFVREQVAGDLLAVTAPAEKRADLIVATGFLAIARRFGHDTDHDMHLTHEDAIDTLGKSILGLTIGCARCHNHKYDPITTRDYYGLYGILALSRFPYPGCEAKPLPHDFVPMTTPAETESAQTAFKATLAKFNEDLKRLEADLAAKRKEAALGPPREGAQDAAKAAEKAVNDARKKRETFEANGLPVPMAYAIVEGKAANARIQKRGEPEDLGEEVPRKNLDVLGGQLVADPKSSGRLELARWLTDAKNPLTARVIVNRIWQGHFGTGLVATPNDFGTRGSAPSDRMLLDSLAATFVEKGWSIKTLHRLLMTSGLYQRANFPRRRLDAEEIRDTLLFISGDLDSAPGEGHPFPPVESWHFTQHNPFRATYDSNKRSVYLMTQRTTRHPFLALFDGADPNASTPGRNVSTVPTQALYFLNDPFFHARAEAFAKHILAQSDETQRVVFAYRHCFQRAPNENEIARALKLVSVYQAELASSKLPAEKRPLAAWSALARVLLGSNELLHLD